MILLAGMRPPKKAEVSLLKASESFSLYPKGTESPWGLLHVASWGGNQGGPERRRGEFGAATEI